MHKKKPCLLPSDIGEQGTISIGSHLFLPSAALVQMHVLKLSLEKAGKLGESLTQIDVTIRCIDYHK